jgi:diguanylate cyclase (GGDEF)-like protein
MPYVYTPEMDAVLAGVPFGYMRTDLHAQVVYSNGYFESYLKKNYDILFEDLENNGWQNFLHPEDKKRLLMFFTNNFLDNRVSLAAVRLLLPGKKTFPILLISDTLVDPVGNPIGFMLNFIDVSLPLHDLCEDPDASKLDPLTHVLTRMHFLNKLDETLRDKKNNSIMSALVVIDVKGLEKFNEIWGYSFGDQLLLTLAEIIVTAIDKKYSVGRLESAKFGVIIDTIDNREKLKDFIYDLYAECNRSINFPQGAFVLEVSIGVAIIMRNEGDFDPLLRHGLEALKAAKKCTPRIEFLDEKDHRLYRRSARIVSYMFDAIAQDQFELHYQPQINIDTHRIIGIEVLLRWNHPDLGIIEPDEFIPIAEDAGFIIHIGKWVIEHALTQFEAWRNRLGHKLDDIKLSINLSPLQLLDQNLIPDLDRVLKKYKMKPENLMFELTENKIMSDPDNNIQIMNRVNDLGVKFSLDDFGTGYSSLNYMRYLPIYQIKIDRSFVKSFQHSRQDAAITTATLSLAEALGVEVIAEGVETAAEIKFLQDNGCKLVQGYYYSHPLNAKGMEEYIEANT